MVATEPVNPALGADLLVRASDAGLAVKRIEAVVLNEQHPARSQRWRGCRNGCTTSGRHPSRQLTHEPFGHLSQDTAPCESPRTPRNDSAQREGAWSASPTRLSMLSHTVEGTSALAEAASATLRPTSPKMPMLCAASDQLDAGLAILARPRDARRESSMPTAERPARQRASPGVAGTRSTQVACGPLAATASQPMTSSRARRHGPLTRVAPLLPRSRVPLRRTPRPPRSCRYVRPPQ